MAGRLDEAYRLGTELLQAGGDRRPGAEDLNFRLAHLDALRGEVGAAREHVSLCGGRRATTCSTKQSTRPLRRQSLLAEGRSRHALETARRRDRRGDERRLSASRTRRSGSRSPLPSRRRSTPATSSKPIDSSRGWHAPSRRGPPVPPGAGHSRQGTGRWPRGEDTTVEENLIAAESMFRELGYPYWVARAQLDRAEWLPAGGGSTSQQSSHTKLPPPSSRSGRRRCLLAHELSSSPR